MEEEKKKFEEATEEMVKELRKKRSRDWGWKSPAIEKRFRKAEDEILKKMDIKFDDEKK